MSWHLKGAKTLPKPTMIYHQCNYHNYQVTAINNHSFAGDVLEILPGSSSHCNSSLARDKSARLCWYWKAIIYSRVHLGWMKLGNMVFDRKTTHTGPVLKLGYHESFFVLFFIYLEIFSVFTRGQFWPSGIVVACVCLSVCVSVCVCVRQPRACPRHKSRRVQARTTKFGQKVQNNLVKVPIVLGGDWPWPSRSNLTWKAKFTPFWACPRHNS